MDPRLLEIHGARPTKKKDCIVSCSLESGRTSTTKTMMIHLRRKIFSTPGSNDSNKPAANPDFRSPRRNRPGFALRSG
jgi:hypothetical protein